MGVPDQTNRIMAKFDPNEIKTIIVRVPGGEVPPVPALAPKVGPMKLSPKSVGEDLCKATKEWKGMRVTCKLHVQNRKVTVEVVPSATALLIKALKEPPRDRKKVSTFRTMATSAGTMCTMWHASCGRAPTPRHSRALFSKFLGRPVPLDAQLTARMLRIALLPSMMESTRGCQRSEFNIMPPPLVQDHGLYKRF